MKMIIIVAFLIAFAVSHTQSRIIRKRSVDAVQVPSYVFLRHQLFELHFCSGVIISPFWILTSARCVHTFNATDLKAVYGSNLLSDANETNDIDMIVVHPKFNTKNFENDIALLLIEFRIEFQRNIVNSIPLATESTFDGQEVTAASWTLENVSSINNP